MTTSFLHGVELIDISNGARPIQTVSSAVIGICGTAPNSQPEVAATLASGLVGSNNAIKFTSALAGTIGNKATITYVAPTANSSALSVSVSNRDITVNLATNSSGGVTTTATLLMAAIAASAPATAICTAASAGGSSGAGVVSAMAQTAFTGGIDEAFPLNTPVLVPGSLAQAALLGVGGTLPDAMDSIFDQIGAAVIVVRVEAGMNDTTTLANVVGGVDSGTGNYNGVHAFTAAESLVGVAPRILIAPGWTHQRPTSLANPVVAELVGIANSLRACIIQDGPSTTDVDAFVASGDFGSPRVYLVDPNVIKLDANGEPQTAYTSAQAAGVLAMIDTTQGYWNSPSNQLINGIIGTDRAIAFTMGDPNSRANLLNANNITTVIRQNGFRLWGNRTLSGDFLCVIRTQDILDDSVQRAHLWAVDQGITKTYVEEVVEHVNAYLRSQIAIGAILGGKCWADPDLNTADAITAGHVYFDFDFTPTYPAERITFRSHLVNDYISTIFSN